LGGPKLPSTVKRIERVVTVGGQTFKKSFTCPCNSNLIERFDWDGRDALGRTLKGSQHAAVDVGYTYQGIYMTAPNEEQAFGNPGTEIITGSKARNELTLWSRWDLALGPWDARAQGLGGWTLSVHHAYDENARVLHLGDGTRRSAASASPAIRT